LLLALVLLVGSAVPALADAPILRLEGASPTFAFTPTGSTAGTYVFTNGGEGTLRGDRVTWTYEERGTVDFANLSQVVDTAAYAVVRYHGANERASEPFVFHVVPSTYAVAYTGAGTPPCTTGTFSARLREGATVQGTFDCLGGLPSGSMEFTIERGGAAELALGALASGRRTGRRARS
jgi:hypothetical protein